MTYEQVKSLVLELSAKEQVRLADAIAENLHGPVDPEIEKSHLEEAERRYSACREGRMTARPMDEVVRDLRAKRK